jgi:hypothetical protein
MKFLNREPDDNWLTFWALQIIQCGENVSCVDRRHMDRVFFYSSGVHQQRPMVGDSWEQL